MGRLSKFCEKVVNKFNHVFFGVEPSKVKHEEKCSYTLSSVFPSVEIQEEAFKILAKLREEESTEKNKEEVSN